MAYTKKEGGHTTIVLEKSDGKLSEQLSELQAVFNHMADTKMGYNDILMELLSRQAKAMTEAARGQEKQLERLTAAEDAIAALRRELEELKNPVLDKPKMKAPEGGPLSDFFHPRFMRGVQKAVLPSYKSSYVTRRRAFGCPHKAGMAKVIFLKSSLKAQRSPARATFASGARGRRVFSTGLSSAGWQASSRRGGRLRSRGRT